ncbi:DUF2935 domain-containing protein [Effusibacillus lacus]|uniref:DUF2935 domain-containing protein n=1 Tax=Effusibacillus lacus TaxID=1348429 RepID=UPI001405278C
MPLAQRKKIALEETLFWSRIHMEHAFHLSFSFLTKGQQRFIREAERFQMDFQNLREQANEVEDEQGNIRKLNRDTLQLSRSWRRYLENTFEQMRACRIPGGHANFPPSLADHMRRETDYLIRAVQATRI